MSNQAETTTQQLTLSGKFKSMMQRFAELEEIPAYRVDVKAKIGQELAVEGIELTGELIGHVEQLEERVKQLENAKA